MKKIVITGPESTGKSTLSEYLAQKFNSVFVPEFARTYVENLKSEYTYDDVVFIARKQIEQFFYEYDKKSEYVFFDTGLIITKIWFREVYGKIPEFLTEALEKIKIDLYLVMYPDIDWKPDNVRENGGEKRLYLFNEYISELKKLKCRYVIIKGEGNLRYKNAVEAVRSA